MTSYNRRELIDGGRVGCPIEVIPGALRRLAASYVRRALVERDVASLLRRMAEGARELAHE